MQPNYQKELKIAKTAARQAGHFLKTEFNKIHRYNIQYKTSRDSVTYCDKQAEAIIIKKIKSHFPSHAILSEESGLLDKPSDFFWTVDPLDGTNNFLTHVPIFAVSLALFYKNQAILGVTYVPILDDMYWAVKNQGAHKNKQEIKVSSSQNLKKMFFNFNHGKGPAAIKQSLKVDQHFRFRAFRSRNYSCTSVQMAMTAAGYFDAYLVIGQSLWDIAAGTIILQEAGAVVTDFKNRPWTIKSSSILATNKKMHPAYLKELKKIKLA